MMDVAQWLRDPVTGRLDTDTAEQRLRAAVETANDLQDAARQVRIVRDHTMAELAETGTTSTDLAGMVGISSNAVRAAISKVRGRTGPARQSNAARLTEEFLRRAYVDEDRTTASIADEVGVAAVTVAKRLDRYGIPRTREKKRVELPYELLHDRYVTQGWSERRIAEEVGCSQPTVGRRLDEYGIKRS